MWKVQRWCSEPMTRRRSSRSACAPTRHRPRPFSSTTGRWGVLRKWTETGPLPPSRRGLLPPSSGCGVKAAVGRVLCASQRSQEQRGLFRSGGGGCLKSSEEIEKMRRAGRVVREVLELVRSHVKPGATTLDLERVAEARIAALGAKPAFKGYHGFPCVLCTSVNSEVVHGIPSQEAGPERRGHRFSGLRGGGRRLLMATRPSPCRWARRSTPETAQLLRVTEASLQAGIAAVKPGATLGDIGAAVQGVVEAHGFSVVQGFCGARHRLQHARGARRCRTLARRGAG